MQVVILCDQEIGVLRIKRFYYFLIMIPCFFHAHLIFHNSLYHGLPWFFHGLFFKLYDTMLSMLFPRFYKIRKHGNSMEKQGDHGKTMVSMLSSMLSLPGVIFLPQTIFPYITVSIFFSNNCIVVTHHYDIVITTISHNFFCDFIYSSMITSSSLLFDVGM